MERLHAFLADEAAWSLAIGGFLIGIVFGAIVQRSNFCTMGSLSDMLNFGDARRFRSWLFAAAVAIAGTQTLHAFAGLDLTPAMYLAPNLDWAGAIVGGLLFGFGMVFAGGCGSRNLVRAGTGDLRSLMVVVVIGISAYATIGGVLGPARAALTSATAIDLAQAGMASQSLGAFLARAGMVAPSSGDGVAALAIVVILGAVTLGDRAFRTSPKHLLGGLGIGLCVTAGWALAALARDEMAATSSTITSLTFVRPSGDTLEWLQRYTAGPVPGFGVASLLGTMLGAFLAAAASGGLKLSTFHGTQDTVRNLLGAVAMGVGGVVALGCTIGQAVTGTATLAAGSFLVFAALVGGGIVGLKALERL